jgi:hypothetical protein
MHILFKYASRSRPERFREGLRSIIDLAANKDDYTVFACLDEDDQTLPQYLQDIEQYKKLVVDIGKSKNKIDAINRPIPASLSWDILVNFSDDMRFIVFGYDQLIRDAIRINGPDIFVHFPDSTARAILPTMSIMDKIYFERDGKIYDPSYISLWADNEAMEVAKLRGRYLYAGTQIFDHFHPAYGMAQWDEQYSRQQSYFNEDELNYIYRKSKNFFLDETAEHSHPNYLRSIGTV